MFFATPHHGMSNTSWQKFATAVLCMNAPSPGVPPTKKMLGDLALNTDILVNLTDDFRALQEELAFVNFIEGNKMKGPDCVLVDKSHGWMDAQNKREFQLEGDHIRMCRFDRRARHAFGVVSKSMRFLIEESPKAYQLYGDARRALHSLCPTGFHGYFMTKQATKGTCEWISERQDFQEWLDDKNDKQMLWIQGPPACGKSYLAKHIITELAPAANKKVSHCFLSNSAPGRGTIAALLRATLHHALRHQPNLVTEFLVPTFVEATKDNRAWVRDDDIWTRESLIPLWSESIAKVLSFRPLTMVVDGFDQVDRDAQQDFLDCVANFKAKAAPKDIKRLRLLLLSSDSKTEEPPLSGQEELAFQFYQVTPHDTLPDMEKTIMKQLETRDWKIESGNTLGIEEEEALRKDICKAVMQHSDGSYLQAAKATEVLVEKKTISDVETARSHLEQLPRDDVSFYRQVLKDIFDKGVNPTLLKHVLRWALFQLEPLREAEFHIALAVGLTMEPNPIQHIALEKLEKVKVGEIKILVHTRCQQVVSLEEGNLQIAHRSIKECLTTGLHELGTSEPGLRELAKHMEQGASHAALASICIAYLTLPYFQHAGIPAGSDEKSSELWKTKVRRRIKSYPFVRYAALNWLGHVDAAAAGEDHQAHPSQGLLQDISTGYGKCWTEVWWFVTKGCMPHPPPTPSHIDMADSTWRFDLEQVSLEEQHAAKTKFDSRIEEKLVESDHAADELTESAEPCSTESESVESGSEEPGSSKTLSVEAGAMETASIHDDPLKTESVEAEQLEISSPSVDASALKDAQARITGKEVDGERGGETTRITSESEAGQPIRTSCQKLEEQAADNPQMVDSHNGEHFRTTQATSTILGEITTTQVPQKLNNGKEVEDIQVAQSKQVGAAEATQDTHMKNLEPTEFSRVVPRPDEEDRPVPVPVPSQAHSSRFPTPSETFRPAEISNPALTKQVQKGGFESTKKIDNALPGPSEERANVDNGNSQVDTKRKWFGSRLKDRVKQIGTCNSCFVLIRSDYSTLPLRVF